ncbi:unnamed protein product [Somion occarium]
MGSAISRQRRAPFGSWESEISAEEAAGQGLAAGIEEVILDPVTSKVYYAQKRPSEGGRSAILDASDGKELLDPEWDVRTRVHEYGGGAAIVFADVLYFSNIKDNRVYKAKKGSKPEPITPVNEVQRFADFTVHPEHSNFIIATLEDHTDPHPARVKTFLALIDANTSTVSNIVEGADFYSCARFSPDGKFLSWQQWNFPELPWQSAEIYVAPVTFSSEGNLELGAPFFVAGKHEAISAVDPSWTSNNSLHFTSDVSGFQNPWKFTFHPSDLKGTGKASPILPEPIEWEFGMPTWYLSRHSSGALTDTKVAFMAYQGTPHSKLLIIDVNDGSITEVPTPYALIQYMRGDGKGKVVGHGEPATADEELFELTLDKDGKPVIRNLLAEHASNAPPSDTLSTPEYYALTLAPDNRKCYATFYPPQNPMYDAGLRNEKPPVVVLIHGGPFSMEAPVLDLTKQFWTSRGWAYVDVNYGGSTGFGRAYRETLHGKWGILDVQDAKETVVELGKLGLVDPHRAVIRGGSAGGYTTLQASILLPDFFAAGSPQYGISEMKLLDDILHKFEYYLCDRLMGGPYEDIPDVWKERSPIYHVDKIKMPLLILQGDADTVIPAPQMVAMVEAIKKQGGKAELVLFEGEGHGWRKASTIKTVLEKQLEYFDDALHFVNKPDYC